MTHSYDLLVWVIWIGQLSNILVNLAIFFIAKLVLKHEQGKVCQVLVNKSEQYKTKLAEMDNKPIDMSKVLNANDPTNTIPQEEQGKMKKLFANIQKNTLKIVNSLANRAIVMLKNCSDVTSGDKIFNGPIDTQNSRIGQLPNGQNVIVVDTTTIATETAVDSTTTIATGTVVDSTTAVPETSTV